jgi:hypothetical protein
MLHPGGFYAKLPVHDDISCESHTHSLGPKECEMHIPLGLIVIVDARYPINRRRRRLKGELSTSDARKYARVV